MKHIVNNLLKDFKDMMAQFIVIIMMIVLKMNFVYIVKNKKYAKFHQINQLIIKQVYYLFLVKIMI